MTAQAAQEDLLVKQKFRQWKISGQQFQALNDDSAPRQENHDPRILHPPVQRVQARVPISDASEDHLVDEDINPEVLRNPTESYHPHEDPDLLAQGETQDQLDGEIVAQKPRYDLRQRPKQVSRFYHLRSEELAHDSFLLQDYQDALSMDFDTAEAGPILDPVRRYVFASRRRSKWVQGLAKLQLMKSRIVFVSTRGRAMIFVKIFNLQSSVSS
jgi:hypothetical protein